MKEQDKDLAPNSDKKTAPLEQEEKEKTAAPSDNGRSADHTGTDGAAAQSEPADAAPSAEEVCVPEDDVNKLTDVITQKNALIETYTARLLRLQADFENYRRRTQKEKDELAAMVTENLLRDFLPILDNFQRALATKDSATASGNLATGVSMIYRQMMGILEKQGVSVIKAEGEAFDPKLHEAVMRVTDAAKPDGLIVEELQCGYLYRGTALRPSMVKVIANN